MTTIAFDGNALAADKQVTCGSMIGQTTKIRRINGMLVGVSGDASSLQMFADWIQLGGHAEKYPQAFKDGDSCAMVIRGDGIVRLYEKAHLPLLLEQKRYAIGSGREFAMAAMACGKTAREAVQIATSLDCYSGQGMDELRFTTDRIDPND